MFQALHNLELLENISHFITLHTLLFVHIFHGVHLLGVSLLHHTDLREQIGTNQRWFVSKFGQAKPSDTSVFQQLWQCPHYQGTTPPTDAATMDTAWESIGNFTQREIFEGRWEEGIYHHNMGDRESQRSQHFIYCHSLTIMSIPPTLVTVRKSHLHHRTTGQTLGPAPDPHFPEKCHSVHS